MTLVFALRRFPCALCAALSLTSALTACAVGPDYRSPDYPLAEQWHELPSSGVKTESPDSPTLAAWWTSLNDAALNQLIERALRDNTTARQALARVVQARARRGITKADFLPSIGVSAGASRTDSESRFNNDIGTGVASSSAAEVYDAGIDSSWEIDLFGGKRRALEASTAQLGASEADLRDVLVTLLGDVALAYVNVRTTQSRLTFGERNLEAQSNVYDITRWRAEAGLASVLDVEQAKTSLEQTRAQLPLLESALTQALNRLAVLSGRLPGELADELGERKPIPVAPLEIVAGVPADAIRRRPDIRAAERRLAAQTAQVGVATAALYPSLSLSGSISLQALSAGDLLSDGFQTNRAGLSLNMPIFSGGALRQNIRVQNALVDEALAGYEATVLGAYEEIENALDAWTHEQLRHQALIEAVASGRRASQLALLQYNSGLVDFQTVLTADRQLISLEDSLAVSDGEITSNLVRLYKSLGGGWSVFPTATTATDIR